MKSTLVWIIFGTMLLCGGDSVSAWGGVFNRFTPELLGNMGYGGGGGGVGGGNSANAMYYEVSCVAILLKRGCDFVRAERGGASGDAVVVFLSVCLARVWSMDKWWINRHMGKLLMLPTTGEKHQRLVERNHKINKIPRTCGP